MSEDWNNKNSDVNKLTVGFPDIHLGAASTEHPSSRIRVCGRRSPVKDIGLYPESQQNGKQKHS